MRHRSGRKGREFALQILYAAETGPGDAADTAALAGEGLEAGAADRTLGEALAELVRSNLGPIDAAIRAHAANWSFERLALTDRLILRIGIAELLFCPEVPAPVVLSEAVQLAAKYGGGGSPAFVNGVLDACNREISSSTATAEGKGKHVP